ncbi:hypothetical protein POM88_010392 [Heracleum sosnowskyi]|uniref:Glycoside hydrolase family 3 C-terminal domain-containing protein n=1 Tax=Heracleum sosnowskyi TaxID=360622 RepID=A0AAD8N092_9APIA|nr:hypothetical protein POM88_010382 [Heracleum sosnowskyi]KAK1391336.1 hypothetical protein POM88_010392 [Heracleum sosnowskyi]
MDVTVVLYPQNYTKAVVMKKKLPVSQIDRALRNLFTVRMRLGLFNGRSITVLSAVQSYVKNTVYNQGCNAVKCTSASISEAVNIAKKADYVILLMGLDQNEEREDFDRVDLVLPGLQQSLITSVAKATKKPVILVLLCGGPVDVSLAKYNPKIRGILWVGYPGEAGGTALAEIIFGDHNPGKCNTILC